MCTPAGSVLQMCKKEMLGYWYVLKARLPGCAAGVRGICGGRKGVEAQNEPKDFSLRYTTRRAGIYLRCEPGLGWVGLMRNQELEVLGRKVSIFHG